jgi:ferredoxin-NADP reductase
VNRYRAELEDRRWLSNTAFELALRRPLGFDFNPGQRIRVQHADAERDYSLTSAPNDPYLSLCIKRIPNGFFTPFLATVRPGATFQFTGPHGYFTFRTTGRKTVFIATGTGIAPFVSMARSGVCNFVLLHGIPNEKKLYFADLWESVKARYIPCISQPYGVPNNAFQGHVTNVIDEVLQPGVYDFYLSGHGGMIREMTHRIDESYSGSNIYTEVFHS